MSKKRAREITEYFPPYSPYPCYPPPKRPCLGVHAYQLECVLPYLNCRDLARAARVCKQWKGYCSQPRVWSKDKQPELKMVECHSFRCHPRGWQDYQLGAVKSICISGIASDEDRQKFRRILPLCTNVRKVRVLLEDNTRDWTCEILTLLFATGARFVFSTTGSAYRETYATSEMTILRFITRNISPSLCGFKVDSAVLPPASVGTVFHPHIKAIECAGYAEITPYPNLEFLNIQINRRYNHRYKWNRVIKCENPNSKLKSLIIHETNSVFNTISPCVLNSIEHLRCTVRNVEYFEKQFKILFDGGYLQKLKRLEVFLPVTLSGHKLRLAELKPKIPLDLIFGLSPYYESGIRIIHPPSNHPHPRVDVAVIQLQDIKGEWSFSEPFRGVKRCESQSSLFNKYAHASDDSNNNTTTS